MWGLKCFYRDMWKEKPEDGQDCPEHYVPEEKKEACPALGSSLGDSSFEVLLVSAIMSAEGFTLASLWSPGSFPWL